MCEHIARQVRGESRGDLHDNAMLELAWTTKLRLPDRITADYRN
ncbi:hypothetical protein ABT040_39650 [Streptomyces sp. NPDC002688]